MFKYPKIQGLYKRDETTHKFIEGAYSLEIFNYLKDLTWAWTEKIDGMNIRVIWIPEGYDVGTLIYPFKVKGGTLDFRGRTNKAELNHTLILKLWEYFERDDLVELFGDTPLTIYGEGCGAGIQKGGGNYSPAKEFIMFDVWRDFWWDNEFARELADKLEIPFVVEIERGTLDEAVDFIKNGFTSTYGDFTAEGIVLKPLHEMNYFRGRIITKVKDRDF